MIYEVGDLARLSVVFKDINQAAADPTTISIVVRAPDNSETTIVYPSTIVRDSQGNYHYDLAINLVGIYYYRWIGTGNVVATQEGQVTCQASIFKNQPLPQTPEFTQADLLAVDAALKSGALRVRFADREVTYRSAADLNILRATIINYLNTQNNIVPVRQSRAFTNKGWSD